MKPTAQPYVGQNSTTVRTMRLPRPPLWVRLGFQVGSRVAPDRAAAAAEWLFFRPHARRGSGTMQDARHQPIDIDDMTIETYSWGDGEKIVLLVHGWAGRASQMAPLARRLAAEGYRTVTFDLPAHGGSSGEQTNLLQVERVIRAIAQELGGIHAIIGHSFGAVASMLAVAEGLAVDRIAVIGAPATLSLLVQSFADAIGASPRATERFTERLEERFGSDAWRNFSPERLSGQIPADAMIVHDQQDNAVPYQQAVELYRSWPGCQRLITNGFGHLRILKQPQVHDAIVDFVRDGGHNERRYG